MDRTYPLGDIQLTLILDATGSIDGNQVFAPASLEEWSPGLPVDAQGNLPLAVHSVLVSGPDGLTLVDTGFGEEERADRPESLMQGLGALGIPPEAIRRVVLTHAHGDHVLGNTLLREGRWVPAFSEAEYVIQEREVLALRQAMDAIWLTRFQPLEERGQLRLVDGAVPLSETISLWPTPGHTIGHQSVLVRSGGKRALIVGDLALFAASWEHKAWGPAWAWSREADRQSRAEVAAWATDVGALLVLPHEPRHPWVRLQRADGSYRAVPAQP